jgi:hypothetical protein
MKLHLVTTTAIAVALAAPAFAQSRNQQPADSKAPPAQTQQDNATGSTAASPASSPSQNNPPASGTDQSAGSTAPPASNSTTTSQAPPSGNNPSQAQTAPPSSAQPSSQQSANPPPANSNQAQQAPAAGTTAQQPNPSNNTAQQQQPANTGTANQQPSTAQSSQTNVNANVNINDQQRTRISQSITRLDVKPLTNINFSISVGTVVPRDVRLATLPPDVIEIVPQYRGYSFFVVKDEIVIVEPSTYKIVTTLPYSGSSTAAAPARERSNASFSDRDREVIRKHTRSDRRPEGRTTGSTARTDIRVGQRLPESVDIEEFPETVYRDAPTLREYRYIHRENRTYMIEPRDRMVIEEID